MHGVFVFICLYLGVERIRYVYVALIHRRSPRRNGLVWNSR